MNEARAREMFAAARVARLATVGEGGQPHLVPVVFAVDGDRIVTAVDHKPKRTTALQRLANIRANPLVSLLVDEYADGDWTTLWWVRADGHARVLDHRDDIARQGVELLTRRYPQYRDRRPGGPVVVIEVARWTAWSAS
ncbi:MAG TPA: TIGR03668 family PPOX class F420-dependent oxidoreductase [Mycobacteriales bacterium]